MGGFARNQIALPDAASITIRAVPEPSGLVVVLSAVGCVLYRRRKAAPGM
ncbi:MAG: PEP-CTERM sorting domain-containing protein [Planctomycetales bacterium]|nr:PEP-CTERM sorting domain-containing protein [Planctomycetales bacterium]